MRHATPPSEFARLAQPIARVLDGAWQRMHWWIAGMAALYAFSGITIVRSDEAAVVLRWGRLVGGATALSEHGPGLLFAFPRPIDEVVRVPVKHINELAVATLDASRSRRAEPALDDDEEGEAPAARTLDPIRDGYALTGDHNIVQVQLIARYRVRDPAQWAFYGASSADALRVEVTAAMVRSLGEMGVDRVLSDGRKDLIATATRRAQQGLDASHSGLELTSIELTSLAPPRALVSDFDAVQSAFIGAETNKKQAEAFAAQAIPGARAAVDQSLQAARGAADSALASARGDASAFRAIDAEYRRNPAVVRERLYRDALDRALASAGSVRWIPPPAGAKYNGLRITVQPSGTAAPGGWDRPPGDE